jgi:predicted ArsR family transcriptional regulator
MLRSEVELETTETTPIILIDQHGQITAREIAETLGMTERPVRRIITELEAAGYLSKQG